jgi:hypothetical protein
MAEVGAQASAAKPAELTLKAKAEDKDHHLWPEVRRHLHCRVQGSPQARRWRSQSQGPRRRWERREPFVLDGATYREVVEALPVYSQPPAYTPSQTYPRRSY